MSTIILTGLIGSGKTTISKLFKELDVPILDADELSRKVVQPNMPAWYWMIESFGSEVILDDQTLDREMIRSRIFNNQQLLDKVEQMIHPQVNRLAVDYITNCTAPYLIYVIPFIRSIAFEGIGDRILFVDVNPNLQLQRVTSRDGVNDADVIHILKNQHSRQHGLIIADDLIENNSSIEQLKVEVKSLHESYLRRSI